MKCQQCDKTAMIHITDLTTGEVVELHLCLECAQQFMDPKAQAPAAGAAPSGVGQLSLKKTAEQLAEIDKKRCPYCGLAFSEFRSHQRLGCPYDYTFFNEELEPLLVNVHGNLEHIGKRPPQVPGQAELRTTLIRLRREMKEAVMAEKYEKASKLRDEIRTIEEQLSPPAEGK